MLLEWRRIVLNFVLHAVIFASLLSLCCFMAVEVNHFKTLRYFIYGVTGLYLVYFVFMKLLIW